MRPSRVLAALGCLALLLALPLLSGASGGGQEIWARTDAGFPAPLYQRGGRLKVEVEGQSSLDLVADGGGGVGNPLHVQVKASPDGGGTPGNPLMVDTRTTVSVSNSAEFCATNAAGGTAGPSLPANSKWYLLQNRGPNNCTCTFDNTTPTLSIGVRYAGLGTAVTDVADNGPGWIPVTGAQYTKCICATAAQVSGGCFQILSVQ